MTIITRLRYEYLSTVDGTARNWPRSPVLRSILAACTAIDELQRICLMSMHGCLPAHICCRSSAQSLHSSRMWRTVWRPWPHGHSSVSVLLMAWRYARRLILPVRICVITELIALRTPACVVSMPLPGRTPSLKSSLPCLAFSHDSSQSPRIVRRIADFVVAISPSQDNGLSIAIGFQWPIIHLEKSTLASLIDAQTHRDQVDLEIWFYWFHKLANAMRCEFQLSQACISSDLLYINSGIILFRDSLILIQHALISLPISWSHNNLLRDRGH